MKHYVVYSPGFLQDFSTSENIADVDFRINFKKAN